MTHIIHTQADLETAVHVLIKQDPRWQPVFATSGMPAIRRREGGYAGLSPVEGGRALTSIYRQLRQSRQRREHRCLSVGNRRHEGEKIGQ